VVVPPDTLGYHPKYWLKVRFSLKMIIQYLTYTIGVEDCTPVPFWLMVCGDPAALSAMLTAPVRVPLAVGVNVTPMVQEAPAATELPQVLVSAKSPLAEMLVMLSVPVPVLVSVEDWGALVVNIV
jgi:hypothetical protein